MKSISGLTYYTKDLKKTADFYERLGFEFRRKESDRITAYLNWFWIDFLPEKNEAAGITKGSGIYLYINVDNVIDFHNDLILKGFKPSSMPEKSLSGNLEFTIADPNGYNLVFFKRI